MHWSQLGALPTAGIRIAVIGGEQEVQPFVDMFVAGMRAEGAVGTALPIEVDGSEFEACVSHLVACGFAGAAIVAGPLKVDAARVAERFFVVEHAVGVANTLKFEGGVFAQNTEVAGVMEVVRDLVPATALVLGTGHAARSVVTALLQLGWKVHLWNRNALRSRPLKMMMLRYGEVKLASTPNPAGCRLVVNATPLGAKAGEHPPVEWKNASRGTVVLDLVYRSVATEFLREASLRGFKTIDGRVLLAEQAGLSLEWLLDKPVAREPLRQALGYTRGS